MISKIARGSAILICFLLAALFTSLAFPQYGRVHWYRQIFLTIMHPFQSSITSISGFVSGTWEHYIALTNAAVENDRLKTELANANRILIEMDEIKKENDRLYESLSMAKDIKKDAIGAKVISSNVMAEFRTMTINKGSNDGILKNMVVIGPGGLVGRIAKVGLNESIVLLISDPNSSVDVFVQRTNTRAILAGALFGPELQAFYSLSRMEYLKKTSDIVSGDVVITSGLDQLYPRGIPVGTVNDVETVHSGVFKNALVVPFVDLAQLKEVLVLK